MNGQRQERFFGTIFNGQALTICVGEETDKSANSPAITISTPALLETLPHLRTDVRNLVVRNFALTRQSDVQALSNIVLAKCETLDLLVLKIVECSVDDCNKQGSNESDGFLDPLFYAVSGLHTFGVLTKTRSVNSMLVSPTALRSLFVEGKQFRKLWLSGLGLTDSHVLAIVDWLSTPDSHVDSLILESNPGITAQGYGALLNLINRTNVIGNVRGRFGLWSGLHVHDKAWEGKLCLEAEMNTKYCRLEYLTNGTFTSEERRWQWLERVVNLRIPDPPPNVYGKEQKEKEQKKKNEAKLLNFIWYTLRQSPEMMQVSQAPTWTRKRKATRSTSPLSGAHSAKTQRL
jgi:hypothetical protein